MIYREGIIAWEAKKLFMIRSESEVVIFLEFHIVKDIYLLQSNFFIKQLNCETPNRHS